MKNIRKRFSNIFLSVVLMCMSLSTTVSAAETTEETEAPTYYNVEVTSEGIASIVDQDGNSVSPASLASSISAYKQGTLTGDPASIQVYPTSEGWGGMGITVKTSSSWSGYMNLDIAGSDGRVPLQGRSVYSNGETQFNNLWHYNPTYYLFIFRGIPSGQSVSVQIWIYG